MAMFPSNNKMALLLKHTILIIILCLIGCGGGVAQDNSPRGIVDSFFTYGKDGDSEGMKRIMTMAKNNVTWGFDNLKSLSVYSIKDCTERKAEGYMSHGRGRVTRPYDVKVYCTEFKISFHEEISMSNGVHKWGIYLIRETPQGAWLIDDWGI